MKIAVCDDEERQLKQIKQYFQQYETNQKFEQIHYFLNATRLLEALKTNTYDLFLLDIELSDMTGLELAKKINTLYCDPFIIFISAYREYALEAYDAEAFHYLVKPVSYKTFERTLKRVCEKYYRNHQKYVGRFNHKIFVFNIGEIWFLESYLRVTYLCTASDKVRIQARLDIEERRLPNQQFTRIHQGYLVNLSHVKNIIGYEMILKDGRRLEISEKRRRSVIKKFHEYLLEYGI